MSEHRMEPISMDLCRPEYQQSQAGVGGISSLPLSALRRAALVAGIAVVGTIPPPAELDLAPPVIEATFVYPASADPAAEDDYAVIRNEIVASGLPMLSDDDLRTEISERKSNRGDADF
jgi:hypothetical protein